MKPFDKALDKIWDRINVSLVHQSDWAAIVDLFDQMVEAGKRVDRVDDISDYLIKKGMDDNTAHDVQHAYEVLKIRQETSKKSVWNPDAIKDLLI